MNKQEGASLQKLTLDMTEIKMVLVGNKELGVKGLVHAQAADEEYKELATERFKQINDNLLEIRRYQENALKAQEDLHTRLTNIEEPLKVLKVILTLGRKVRTKSVVVWTLVGSGLTGIVKAWDAIVSFFQPN